MAGLRVIGCRYCGVHRSHRLMDGNYVAYFHTLKLGSFVTPEEAALAHNHAAAVLDGAETPPNAIPSDRMPNHERQRAIEATVEKCVRQANEIRPVLQPMPLCPSGASGYMAVSATRSPGRWLTNITLHGHCISVGCYQSKHEAAYAYNYVVELLGDQTAPTNVIPNDFFPLLERRLEIHGLVEHHLYLRVFATNPGSSDRAVKISGISKTSGYRGVRSMNKDRQWIAYLIRGERTIDLGHYVNKHEAALAFNHAVQVLGADHIPLNLIPANDRPALEHQTPLKLLVKQRLWQEDLLQQQPLHGDYSEYLFRHLGRQGYHGVKLHSASKRWHVVVPFQGKVIAVGYFKTEHEAAFAFNHAAQCLDLPDWLKNPIADEHMPDPTTQQQIQAKVENKVLHGRAQSLPASIPKGDHLAEAPTAVSPATGPFMGDQTDALDIAFQADSPANDAPVALGTECL